MRIKLGSHQGLEGFFKSSVFFNTEYSCTLHAERFTQKTQDQLQLLLDLSAALDFGLWAEHA
jgi:hypothetical protein